MVFIASVCYTMFSLFLSALAVNQPGAWEFVLSKQQTITISIDRESLSYIVIYYGVIVY